jgi:rhamnosyltransferase
MDQDSCFQNGNYFKAFGRSNFINVAIFCPTSDSSLDFNINDIDETTEDLNVITSGNLLNLEIWKTLDGFEQKLFIDEVDNDYCLKANLNGFKIIRFINIPLVHELGQNKEVTFFFKKYTIITHPPIRAYYIFRNNFYIFSKYKYLFPEFVKSRKIMLLKVFIKILLFSENRIQNCRYIFAGIKDYFHGSYGSYLSEKPKIIAE